MLHITNGDSAGDTLKRSSLAGDVLTYPDVLHEGPVPAGLGDERLREVRSRFLAERGYCSFDAALERFVECDRTLDRSADHDEVVLWFEHDLFDQLILIRLLERFARHPHPALTLVCIDRFPGVEPFYGLGQLDEEQLASLFPFRQHVTREQLDLGTHAWRAFRSSNPEDLEALIHGDTSPLPFLAGALRRELEEYPSAANGLTRTEQQSLRVAADNPSTVAELFKATYSFEERPFMGDSTYFAYIRDLAGGERPLIQLGAERAEASHDDLDALRDLTVYVTTTGQDVLEGRNDRIRLNGIDLWRGGVHLTRDSAWRWDTERARLTRA
jgi:Domain of unknown function (DUF1835)